MPGLVNAHHHAGLTPFQMGTPDLPLELWTIHRFGKRTVNLYLDTLYAAMEMIESGVTTVQHLQSRVGGSIENVCKSASNVLQAYSDIGMRVSYSLGLRDQNRLVYEADHKFLSKLPQTLARDTERMLRQERVSVQDNLKVFHLLRSQHSHNRMIAIQLAPINLHWCSDEALESLADCAKAYDVPVHMHILETRYQKRYASKRAIGGAINQLKRIGLLGPKLTLGHCVWTTESELDLLASTDTNICHIPSSNLRLRSGIASVNAMHKRGLRIALGIDEAGMNDDRDMLQEMRIAFRLHRSPGMCEEEVLQSSDILKMATENGARTTGFGSDIGTLKIGKAADVVLLNYESLSFPYLDQETSLVDAIVYRAKSGHVDMVIINGELIYKNGKFARIDKEEVMKELARSLRVSPSASEVKRRRLARRLLPYVRRYFEAYMRT